MEKKVSIGGELSQVHALKFSHYSPEKMAHKNRLYTTWENAERETKGPLRSLDAYKV